MTEKLIKYEGDIYKILYDEKGLPRYISMKKGDSWIPVSGKLVTTVEFYGTIVEDENKEEKKIPSHEDAKNAMERGVFYGFVPRRLNMEEFPEFINFPFNVLFQSRKTKDGELISGTALYEPDFHTYKKEGHLSLMRYHNIYGGDCYLVIAYDEKNKAYRGNKYINDKLVGSADGSDNWEMFFTHLTMIGVVNGERCKFDTVPRKSQDKIAK